ncbi:hypothetical protein KCW65_27045, partial [Mycobacterium tuberculosis]|nr:hypothetical protein [Mycobacterium tuberculosis]
IDPAHPLVENDGFLPDPFTVADYRARVAHLGATPDHESPTTEEPTFAVAGGAVVSGSFQGFDQGYLVEALRALGPTFVGVTQLPADTP